MRKTTRRWRAPLTALLLLVTACSGDRDGAKAGGHTNWLPCREFAECIGRTEAVACKHGYCIDERGLSIEQPAREGEGDAQIQGEMDAAVRQEDDASPAVVQDGAVVEGGDGALVGDADASLADAAVFGQRCGPTICPPLTHCCDACLGYCLPQGSGAACPGGAPGTLCHDGGIAEPRIPTCPGPMARCASERCLAGMECVTCPVGKVCLELELYCGPAGGSTAQCVDWPCGDIPLSSACANSVCNAIDPANLFATANIYPEGSFPLRPGDAPILACTGGGICAAPDTPIATPHGEVPIAQLRAGDLVLSLHEGRVRAVPLVAVTQRRVFAHRVMQIELTGGARIEVSAPHPLADGRPLGTLRVGEAIDGQMIVAIDVIDYPHAYTYDILPASDSAAYLASGLWLGSTLQRRRD